MLELRDVSKRYGAITAVSHLDLVVRPGEVLGYLGPNGSGKSTTVKMVVGLTAPTRGVVAWNGTDIQTCLTDYKALVGYVPEEAHVYTYLTASEYLRLCGQLRGISGPALEQKITQFLHTFGLDQDLNAPMSSFSKGMRQKVLLSAALLHRPQMLVLDEPASGLDVSTSIVMREVVRALAADGCAVFYSSHELDTVERISTRVVILSAGAVVADDSVTSLRELMRAPSLEDVFSQLAVRDDVARTVDAVLDAVRA